MTAPVDVGKWSPIGRFSSFLSDFRRRRRHSERDPDSSFYVARSAMVPLNAEENFLSIGVGGSGLSGYPKWVTR